MFSILRFIQKAPLLFLQSAAAKPVLMCAIAACSLDHKEANASVMKFITEFVKASKVKDVSIEFNLHFSHKCFLTLKVFKGILLVFK